MMRRNGKKELERLGDAIRRRRFALKYSQVRLAAVCGFHRTYISLVERGRRNPIFTNLVTMARGLKTTISRLTKEIR